MSMVSILPFQSQNYKYVQDTLFTLVWDIFSSFKVLVELKFSSSSKLLEMWFSLLKPDRVYCKSSVVWNAHSTIL